LAALKAGYGFDTTWDSTIKNNRGQTIKNSGRRVTACDPRRCELDEATIQSYNFPFYWLANDLGPDKVAEAAHAAGVSRMWGLKGKPVDLATTSGANLKKYLSEEVGFGQFPILTLDHANGVATIAADGVYNKAHFVRSVEQRDPRTGVFKRIRSEKLDPKQNFDRSQVSDLDSVLRQIPGHNGRNLDNGRSAIGKTGTWELSNADDGQNGDAWMVGATRQIATAVWVGNFSAKGNPLAIKLANGKNMTGGSVPGAIWKMFMDSASRAMDAPIESFPDRIKTGNPDKKGNGLPALQQQTDCIIQILCDNGQGNNGGQGNGQGNGQDQPGTGNNGNGNGGNGNGGADDGNGGNGNRGNGNGRTFLEPGN
jgi:membrane peptidoglycan carboxypeptidase